MDVSQAIRNRRSIRSFTGEAPDEAKMHALLEAAQAAPVAMGNYDKYRLTVVTDHGLLDQIDRVGALYFGRPELHPLHGAPVLMVVSAEEPRAGRANAVYSSAAMIAHNVALAATGMGVGQCCIWGAVAAMASRPELVAMLGLPAGFVPCCGVALGETDQQYAPRDIPAGRIAVNTVA